MNLYFITRQPVVCESISYMITNYGVKTHVFSDVKKVQEAISKDSTDNIALIAIDLIMFDHDLHQPFEELIEQKKIVPLVYYNDPFPDEEKRIGYWIDKNVLKYKGFMKRDRMIEAYPLLHELSEILKNEDIKRCVSLINKPFTMRPPVELSDLVSDKVPANLRLAPSRYKLCEYLFMNRNRIIAAQDMCLFLWNEFSPEKLNTLYTYIHDIRKVFSFFGEESVVLHRVGKQKYYFGEKRISADSAEGKPLTARQYFSMVNKNRITFNVTK